MTTRSGLTGERLAQFAGRLLQDALAEATSDYWRRRGEAFLAAAPKPGDFNGRATPEEIRERGQRCRETAQACFSRASIEQPGQTVSREVWEALTGKAA